MGPRSRAASSVPFPPLPPNANVSHNHGPRIKSEIHTETTLSPKSQTFVGFYVSPRKSFFCSGTPPRTSRPGSHPSSVSISRCKSQRRRYATSRSFIVFNCVRTAQSCGRTFGSLAQLAQNTRWWVCVLTLVSGRAWARVWERNCRGHGWGRTAVQTHSADLPWWSLSSRFPASTRHWLSPASLTSEEGRREERPPHGLNVHFP